jgi:hypothetical protein
MFLYGNVDGKKDLEAIMKYSPLRRDNESSKDKITHKNSMSIYAYYVTLHDIIVYRPVLGRYMTTGFYESQRPHPQNINLSIYSFFRPFGLNG